MDMDWKPMTPLEEYTGLTCKQFTLVLLFSKICMHGINQSKITQKHSTYFEDPSCLFTLQQRT